jgi:hypothetical protein
MIVVSIIGGLLRVDALRAHSRKLPELETVSSSALPFQEKD